MSNDEMYRVIEGILFVSNEPIQIKGIAAAIDKSEKEAAEIMDEMIKRYEEDGSRGVKIVKVSNKYQLVTKQEIFGYLTKVNTSLEKPKISPAMLETLAIIAYKQPITKLEIENIRGVQSDYVVNKLLEYELVGEVGRAEKIGRPILFGTTDKFLIYFGLENLNELPAVAETKEITNENIDEELVKLKASEEKEKEEEMKKDTEETIVDEDNVEDNIEENIEPETSETLDDNKSDKGEGEN